MSWGILPHRFPSRRSRRICWGFQWRAGLAATGPCTGWRSSEPSWDTPSRAYHRGSKHAGKAVSGDTTPMLQTSRADLPSEVNAPLPRFCRCYGQTRRGGRRCWRLGTGRAFSAAWRQPARTESSAARGFPHWSTASSQRSQWSA